jgi:peroxiredoxin
MLELGTAAPDFALTNTVTGNMVRRDDFKGKSGLLVMFICTHCPFVKNIESSLGKLGAEYASKPIGIVAVSSNDVATHPADSPAGMKAQARTHQFKFPYLYDESQQVARAYSAVCTPDFFVFDKNFRLVYRGQYDSSRPGNGMPVTGEDLRAAIDTVLAGKPVSPDQRPSIGCNIKWKA